MALNRKIIKKNSQIKKRLKNSHEHFMTNANIGQESNIGSESSAKGFIMIKRK